MSLRQQLDAVKSIAQTTNKIGKLFEHLIWTISDQDMVSFYKDANGRIDVAMITRESTSVVDRGVNNKYDRHSIVLRWYRSVHRTNDDSTNTEDGFQDDVEAVRAAFDANRKLTVAGTHYSALLADAMVARLVGYVMFVGVFCHYAELVLVPWDGPYATQSA